MPITAADPFKWRHYPGDIILWCVRWYLRYPLSVAQMAEMTVERGLAISVSCVWRWVQVYGPELEKRCRRHLKPTNRSWRLDEIYIASMKPILRSKAGNASCTGRSIPAAKKSTFCSLASVMQQPRNASSAGR